MFWRKKQRLITWTSMNGADLVNQDFRALTRWQEYTQSRYTAILGWNQDNQNPVFLDLEHAPHALIAGGTGSGKSVGMNTMLASLLVKNTPVSLELYIIDPKRLDYSKYKGLPHLRGYAVGVPGAANLLAGIQREMMARYDEVVEKIIMPWGIMRYWGTVCRNIENQPPAFCRRLDYIFTKQVV